MNNVDEQFVILIFQACYTFVFTAIDSKEWKN